MCIRLGSPISPLREIAKGSARYDAQERRRKAIKAVSTCLSRACRFDRPVDWSRGFSQLFPFFVLFLGCTPHEFSGVVGHEYVVAGWKSLACKDVTLRNLVGGQSVIALHLRGSGDDFGSAGCADPAFAGERSGQAGSPNIVEDGPPCGIKCNRRPTAVKKNRDLRTHRAFDEGRDGCCLKGGRRRGREPLDQDALGGHAPDRQSRFRSIRHGAGAANEDGVESRNVNQLIQYGAASRRVEPPVEELYLLGLVLQKMIDLHAIDIAVLQRRQIFEEHDRSSRAVAVEQRKAALRLDSQRRFQKRQYGSNPRSTGKADIPSRRGWIKAPGKATDRGHHLDEVAFLQLRVGPGGEAAVRDQFDRYPQLAVQR